MKQARKTRFGDCKKQATEKSERPLTEKDRQLLEILTDKYNQLGRSPTTAEVPQADSIKGRFGLWKNALAAANLPQLNDPEQQKLRQKEKNECKTKNSSSFFQNHDCKYFPCHKNVPIEEFNCLFCYCPLYLLGKDCGCNFTYLPNGVKSCMDCSVTHRAGGYDYVMEKCSLIMEKIKKTPED